MKEGDVADIPDPVICGGCEKTFTAFSQTQAVNCDATCANTDEHSVVTCHYGSDYDLMIFSFKRTLFPKGSVCDACIREAVIKGHLTSLDSYASDMPADTPLIDKIKNQFPNLSGHDLITIAKAMR